MQIPEDITHKCQNWVRDGSPEAMQQMYDYLLTCDFTVLHFVRNDDYAIQNCTSNQIWLNQAVRFNDEHDIQVCMPQEFDFLNDFDSWNIKLRDFNQNFIRESVALASLTTKHNLYYCSLWDRYADAGTGICIEYHITDLIQSCLTYNHDWHYAGQLYMIAPVIYKNDAHIMYFDNTNTQQIFFSKDISWASEHEWRILLQDNKPIVHGSYFDCAPRAIYLGYHCDFDKNKDLISLVQKHNIPIFQTHMVLGRNKIQIVPIL